MTETDAIIGDESSGGMAVRGHIAGKDGIYAAALLEGMPAVTGKSVSGLYRAITDRYDMLHYEDAAFATPARKPELQEELFTKGMIPDFGNQIHHIDTSDGCKIWFTGGSWVICRFSGTGPLLRFAAESKDQAQAAGYIETWNRGLAL